MIGLYTAAQVRAAEAARTAQLPSGSLMQQASYRLATAVIGLLRERTGGVYGRRVLLLIGPGGNGGDALYAGVTLRRRGIAVSALLLAGKTYPGALAAYLAAGGTVLAANDDDAQIEHAQQIEHADAVVDGIAGLGSGRALDLPPATTAALHAHDCVIAVDAPSGVTVDTGRAAADAVRARATVTFGCHTIAHFLAPAAMHCGELQLVDLGLGPHLSPPTAGVLEAAEVYRSWPRQPYHGHKYATGVVAIAAGSGRYPGAAVLCVGGAVRAKAGMVRYVGDRAAADRVIGAWPECVLEPDVPRSGRAQAWVVGPGLGTDAQATEALDAVLAEDVPVVIDADGLTLLGGRVPELAQRRAAVVLTPHAGEFERLFFPIDDPLSAARRAAEESGCVVLLKGPTTVIAAPDTAALINPTGTALLATAGSGDVLAGMVGSLLASGIEPQRAAAMAAYAHGEAAARARGPLIASDLPVLLHQLLADRLA